MRIKKLQKLVSGPILISNQENLNYLLDREFIDESLLLITPKRAVLFGGILEQVSGIRTDHPKNIGKYLRNGSVLEIEGGLRVAESDFIKKAAKGIKLKVVPSPVRKMRLIKDASELREMQKAYEITAKVFAQIKKVLKEKPWTENELARFIKLAGLKLGADDVSFPTIVASGKNSATPHHKPSSKEIKPREPIVLDFGFKVNGYCSDFTRTIFIKSSPAKIKMMYEATELAYRNAIDATKAGVLARDVDSAARSTLKKHKLDKYFIHSLGHGTGLAVHETPNLYPKSEDILQNGMVFSIEPGVYIPKLGGIRIEDLVYLQNGKLEYFVKVPTDLKSNII
jgi:Xaa-Pro aminopeptidase